MDPLSITASIIAILQITVKISEGLRDAKNVSTDRSQFTSEISNLSKLLVDLLSRLDESSDDPWHVHVRQLGGKGGLLSQYRTELGLLKDKISYGIGMKKVKSSLIWRYIRNDAECILSRIGRLKTLVQIALEMDHLFVLL